MRISKKRHTKIIEQFNRWARKNELRWVDYQVPVTLENPNGIETRIEEIKIEEEE